MGSGLKRSWKNFSTVVIGVGLSLIFFGGMFISYYQIKFDYLIDGIGFIVVGLAVTAGGAKVYIWDWKNRTKYTHTKVDKSLEYTFMLATENGEEDVTDFSQIVRALARLEKTRKGTVKVSITPAMGSIRSVDCSYSDEDGVYYTYYLQERENGLGYWFSKADGTWHTRNNLKRLYVQRKKVDYEFMNRKETGEDR